MRKYLVFLLCGLLLGTMFVLHGEEKGEEKIKERPVVFLNKHLMPLKPFVGKTWKGSPTKGNQDKSIVDLSHWERALGGQAVRVRHTANQGMFTGEMIIIWDPVIKSIVYHYFTSAGKYYPGTITFVDKVTFVAREKISGHPKGITETEATTQLLPDGKMRTRFKRLRNGKWEEHLEYTYAEAPGAKLVFE